MGHRSTLYHLGFIALFTVCIAGCGQQGGAAKGAQKGGGGGGRGAGGRGQVVNVKTATVQRISIQRSIDLSGTLISPDQARISNEVAGVVRDVLVEIGQEVTVGQELVRLDTTELKLALDRAESALRQTEIQLGVGTSRGEIPDDDQSSAVRTAAANRDDARNQINRVQQLSAKGLASKVDYETAQTRMKLAEAAYEAAVENVRALKVSLLDRQAAVALAAKDVNDA